MDSRQQSLNAFATGCFRDIADGDYISARSCFQFGLDHQFLWQGQQALEKYLKAILLYNGRSAKGIRHDLLKSLDTILNIEDFDFEFSDRISKTINYFNQYGPNRYFEFPYHIRTDNLLELDEAVWHIRRFCTYLRLTFTGDGGEEKSLLEWEVSNLNQQEYIDHPHLFPGHMHGRLEDILKDMQSTARAQLVWNNRFYGKRAKRFYRGRMISRAANPIHYVWEDVMSISTKWWI